VLQLERARRAARGVQRLERAGLRPIHHRVRVAADAVMLRLVHVTRPPSRSASTALPPRFSTSRPTCVDKGWLLATIAWLARTIERPARKPENSCL